MPKLTKANGEEEKSVTFEKVWFEVPVESGSDKKKDAPKNTETYLLPLRVAEYIVLLENGREHFDLPKINKIDTKQKEEE